MNLIVRLLAVVIASSAASALAAQGADAKPNVIFILTDDLGYGDLGCYGQQKIKTPNIDRLAAGGMRFTQHYAGSTVCAPSRACLLTGQHTGHTVVRGNPGSAVKEEKRDTPLPAKSFTFAKLFKQSGYATAVIGKWGMGHPGTSGEPSKQGFDYFYGYAGHQDAHSYYPPHLWRNDEKAQLDGKQYAHDLIGEEALKWVRQSADKPFMLYLTFTIPHSKLQVPELGEYAKESWPEPEKTFAAMITRMDSSVGKVLDLLDELKIDGNTLVLFSSDNGPHKEGGHSPEFFDSNGPLRGIKRDLYEGGVRVPFIARWPGRIAAGTTSDHISAFWDFVPTAAEVLGTSRPRGVDGISYLPALLGRPEQKKHEALYWEFQEQDGKQAVRMGNWKAVKLNVSKEQTPAIELYDLSKDLGETSDVAAVNPAVVKQADAVMKASRQPSKVFPLFPHELASSPPTPRSKGKAKNAS